MALYFLVGGLFAIALADLAGINLSILSSDDDDGSEPEKTGEGDSGSNSDPGVFERTATADIFLQTGGGPVDSFEAPPSDDLFAGTDGNDAIFLERSEGLTVDGGEGVDYIRAPLGTNFNDSDAQSFFNGLVDTFVIDVSDEALSQDPPLISRITAQANGSGDATPEANIFFNLPEDTDLFSYVDTTNNTDGALWSVQVYLSPSADLERDELAQEAQLIAEITLVDEAGGDENLGNIVTGGPTLGFSNDIQGVFQDEGLELLGSPIVASFDELGIGVFGGDLRSVEDLIVTAENPPDETSERTVFVGAGADASGTTFGIDTPVEERLVTATQDDDFVTASGDLGVFVSIDPGFGNDTVTFGLGDTILEQDDESLLALNDPDALPFPEFDGEDTYNLVVTSEALQTAINGAAISPAVIQNFSPNDVLNVTLPEDEGWSLHAIARWSGESGEAVFNVDLDLTLYASKITNPSVNELESGVATVKLAEIDLGAGNIGLSFTEFLIDNGLDPDTTLQNTAPIVSSNVPVETVIYGEFEDGAFVYTTDLTTPTRIDLSGIT